MQHGNPNCNPEKCKICKFSATCRKSPFYIIDALTDAIMKKVPDDVSGQLFSIIEEIQRQVRCAMDKIEILEKRESVVLHTQSEDHDITIYEPKHNEKVFVEKTGLFGNKKWVESKPKN